MNELQRHLDVYDDNHLGYPRRIPLNKTPPLKATRQRPKLRVGDLVAWSGNSWFAQRFGVGATGIVLDVRWMLADWNSKGVTCSIDEWQYIPEACILWCNGELTNTSFGAVERLSRKKEKSQVQAR